MARHGPLGAVAPLEPALEVLGDTSCGAVSSRGGDARSGGVVPGRHAAGGGAAREIRRVQRPWAERRVDGGSDRPYTTCGMPPPASRPLGAQRSRPLPLPVLTPEKPESFCLDALARDPLVQPHSPTRWSGSLLLVTRAAVQPKPATCCPGTGSLSALPTGPLNNLKNPGISGE